jgi:hypothetical protein
MNVSSGLDWISCTFPHDYNEKWQLAILPFEGRGIETRAHLGYTICQQFATGALMMSNPERPDMGIHTIYSSEAIRSAKSDFECSDEQLLHYLARHGRITRLDVRLDVRDLVLNIRTLYKRAMAGRAETQTVKIGYVSSAKVGAEKGAETCYIGSMKKRTKLLRVYDIAMQLGTGGTHTRFELEAHGRIATNAAKTLKSANFDDYGAIIAGMIKRFCEWPDYRPCQRIFDDTTPIAIDVPAHVYGDTEKWLLDTVAPTLARQTLLNPALLTEFMIRIADYLQKDE